MNNETWNRDHIDYGTEKIIFGILDAEHEPWNMEHKLWNMKFEK